MDEEETGVGGPTNRWVGENVKRLRSSRGWSLAFLGAELESAGIISSRMSLSRLESNGRKVDVDELTALAHVFDVTPLTLLLPRTDSADELVRFTGDRLGYNGLRAAQWNEQGIYTARDLWEWGLGLESLKTDDVHGGGKSSVNLWRKWQFQSFPDWFPHPPRPKDEDYDG